MIDQHSGFQFDTCPLHLPDLSNLQYIWAKNEHLLSLRLSLSSHSGIVLTLVENEVEIIETVKPFLYFGNNFSKNVWSA